MRAKPHIHAVIFALLSDGLRILRKYASTPGKIQFYKWGDQGIGRVSKLALIF